MPGTASPLLLVARLSTAAVAMLAPMTLPTAADERREDIRTVAVSAAGSHGGGRWSWPLSPRPRIVRAFDPPAERWSAGHRGIDLLGADQAQVLAPQDGTVAFRGLVAGRQVLSIDHPGGLRSTYEPVSSTLAPGDAVRRGQVVGQLLPGGDCPPQVCLHLGARRGKDYVDPARLLRSSPPVLLPLR